MQGLKLRLDDRHGVEAFIVHVERLAVVALALADVAGDVDVGQEVHLDLHEAVALARLAAPALDVEREAPGLVAAHPRLLRPREQRADEREDAGVGGGVAARCTADGRLVDVDDLVDVLGPLDARVRPRPVLRAMQHLGERAIQDVVDERRLARARHAGHARERAERDGHGLALEVVLARLVDRERVSRSLAAGGGHLDRARAREELTGERLLVGDDLVGGSDGHHVAAQLAGAGAEIDDEVRRADRLFVVLDHQHRVAQIAQPPERVEEPAVVALVEPDRRLVEDIEDADQARADLGGEPDALALAAGERARRPVEGEVLEAHVGQEAEALANLLQHAPRDGRLALAELESVEEYGSVLDGQRHHVGDGLARDLETERLRPQARALAHGARALGHERLDLAPGVLGLGLPVAPLEDLHHALEAAVAVAVQDHVAHGLPELGPRLVEGELVALGERGERLLEVDVLATRPRRQRAGRERAVGVGHQPLGVDLEARADAAALRAGAVRVVEREHARRHLGEGDATVRTGEALTEDHRLGGWETARSP